MNTLQGFSMELIHEVHCPQNLMNVFNAKVGVRVYPLVSHNIDRAVLCGSKLQPCSRNIGRQTRGSMSMWGAYRPIKAAVPIPIGRLWWTACRERGREVGRIVREGEWVVPSARTAFKSSELSWNLVKGQPGKTQMRLDYQTAQGLKVSPFRPWQQQNTHTKTKK